MMKISKRLNRLRTIGHNLQRIVDDPERKSLPKMCWEFLLCSIANRCIAVHYLTSLLYRQNVHNYLDYISRKEANEVQEKINDPKLVDIITNKLMFTEHFAHGGLPVPRLLGYNISEKIYLSGINNWEVAELSSPQALKESLNYLMSLWGIEEIFLKPIRGTQGSGAYKVTHEHLHNPYEIERLHSAICNNSCLLQQVVAQHHELSRLNSCSLNTIRIDTFRAPRKKAEILSAFLRVGGKNNYVDNVSAGGVFVGIHMESGKLKERAMNLFHGSQTFGTFKANPTNGIIFDGFQVPLFDEVKQTVIRAAEYIPTALVGWDVAVSPTGPVLIEANVLYYGIEVNDMAYGGYRKNPGYQKVVAYARTRS